jgi:hypothetical protein
MKKSAAWAAAMLLLLFETDFTASFAASLVTSQNSTLSATRSRMAADVFPWATNLTGSNFMLSSVVPGTLHGGHASLVNSLQWIRQYRGDLSSSAIDMTLRKDGSVVVSGYSSGFATSSDFGIVCYARDGTAQWTNRYDGPLHGPDYGRYVASNPSGDVWVLGESGRGTSYTPNDMVLIKYASNGVPLWTNRWASFETNSSYPEGLGVDASGSAYVLEQASAWSGAIGTPVGTAISKFDSSGNNLWTKRYFANGPNSGQGIFEPWWIGLDSESQLIVAGSSGGPSYTTGTAIIKFSGDGTAVWTNFQPFATGLAPRTIQFDSAGSLIISSDGWDGPNAMYEISKCSSNGVKLWSNSMAGPFYQGGYVPQAVTDLKGNVFAVGGSAGRPIDFYDVVKFNGQGIPLWTNQAVNFGSSNGYFVKISTDSAGNLWLLGGARASGQANSEIVVLKLSSEGFPLWTNRFAGTAGLGSSSSSLALDGQGGVFVSGSSSTSPGRSDLVALQFADNLVYVPPLNFTGTDEITCVLADDSGNTATGSVTVVVLPTSFRFTVSTSTNWMTPAGFHVELTGFPGTNAVVLEASSDLISWQRILTNAPNAGAVGFLDSAAASRPRRFYRASQEP